MNGIRYVLRWFVLAPLLIMVVFIPFIVLAAMLVGDAGILAVVITIIMVIYVIARGLPQHDPESRSDEEWGW